MKLSRLSNTPILSPNPENHWEAGAVFNCAAIAENEKTYLIYRATDVSSRGSDGIYYNSLGIAESSDGIHFQREKEPILTPSPGQEARGPEDPRIVKIDGIYQMLYTGYGGRFPSDWRVCRAESTDLHHWNRKGVVLDEPNKDASLFPEKISGYYVMLHRRPPDIWLAYSKDLKTWENHSRIMQPVPGSNWEGIKIGIAGPPFKTKDGWVLIYHGVGTNAAGLNVYSLGIALLDGNDPEEVLFRQTSPILEPELAWEINGYVPNVIFSCGQVIRDEVLTVYYAGADTAIGAASISLSKLFN
jgi:beta-1,2-mannobiose phosphorylase / 1,2-beta-oligomannan phosphorylase